MARPLKETVDYFPHDATASAGDTLTVLENQFKNDGYAFWFKLLERLASTDGHFIDCRNPAKWKTLLAKCHLTQEAGEAIMVLLVEMEAIDRDLWKSRVIWCQHLVDNFGDVYKNRRRPLPQKPVISSINPVSTDDNPSAEGVSTNGNRQRKGEGRKGKEIITTTTGMGKGSLEIKEAKAPEKNTGAGPVADADSVQGPEKLSAQPDADSGSGAVRADAVSAEQNPVAQVDAVSTEQDPNLTAIVLCYENNIGQIIPMVAEELKDISQHYPPEWFPAAVREACENNARKLTYIKRILERWHIDGFKAPRRETRQKKGAREFPRKEVKGVRIES